MFDFHEKRKIRGVLYSGWFILAIFVVSGLLSIATYNRFVVAQDIEKKLDVKQAELDALEARAAALESKVKRLEGDRGIEEELRTRFDVAREGEQVIVILDDEKKQDGKPADSVPADISNGTNVRTSLLDFLKFW